MNNVQAIYHLADQGLVTFNRRPRRGLLEFDVTLA
jgi:hypothetical protein